VIIPPPKPRWYVTFANTCLDFAINGLGANAAYAAIIASEPWLGGPFIGGITKWFVGAVVGKIEQRIQIGVDKILIRFGADIRKAKYDEALKPIKEKDTVTDEELKAAIAAIDSFSRHS
jgi:hypothetical protein